MNAIETKSLTKRYGKATAVDQLNLSVAQGEFFALLGVNGAGKSTTIRMLCGLTAPTEGDALVMGESIVTRPQRAKRFIGVSPQETAVAPGLTARENLELMAGVYGCRPQDARDRTARIMEDFHLTGVARQRAGTLSGGWQRRLSIAMALVSEPGILFLDEPTLGLDVIARRELWTHIRCLKGKITVVLTTHYLEEAEELADRIGVMARGRLVAAGSARELMEASGQSAFEDVFIALAGESGEN